MMPKPIQPSKYGLVGLELPVTCYVCPLPELLLEFYGDVGLALCPGLEGGQLAADGTPQDPNRDSSWKIKGSWAHEASSAIFLGPTVALIMSSTYWSGPVPFFALHTDRERERERAETSLNLTKIISE